MALKHKPYELITLEAVDDKHKAPKYYARLVKGCLEGFTESVHAIISKKRPGDKFLQYFVCTDTTLSVQQALRIYQKRWPVEVDNSYLKNALGLGDFRQQSFEATVCCSDVGHQLLAISHGAGFQQEPFQVFFGGLHSPASSRTFYKFVALGFTTIRINATNRDLLARRVFDIALGNSLMPVLH
ncbi:MAG: hypothetical protein WCK35_12990 [Chloroflexota bacterium]